MGQSTLNSRGVGPVLFCFFLLPFLSRQGLRFFFLSLFTTEREERKEGGQNGTPRYRTETAFLSFPRCFFFFRLHIYNYAVLARLRGRVHATK